jgi:hypothetical protein
MAQLRNLEQRAREAILKHVVENYKKTNENWLQQPLIRKAILSSAFYRLENAVLIAGTILATGCLPLLLSSIPDFSNLAWLSALVPLALGAIAEVVFLYFSLKNEKLHGEALGAILQNKVEFTPTRIQDKNLKARVDQALEYWSQIDEAIDRVPKGVLQDRLMATTREVAHWLQAVYNLAERVDQFRLNKVVDQDLRSVPVAIRNYEQKLREEDNPEVRQQLERTIADKKRQLQILQALQDSMEKADYQLDSTISSLGTIYSQLLLVGSKDEEGGRIHRLQEEVAEQVNRLEDLAEAMDEVYQRTA